MQVKRITQVIWIKLITRVPRITWDPRIKQVKMIKRITQVLRIKLITRVPRIT